MRSACVAAQRNLKPG